MDWEVIASTGEWAGAIAVVATLVYLAKQLKQQNDVAKYEAWASVTEGFTQVNAQLFENDEILRIFTQARTDIGELTDLEAFKYTQFMMLYFNQMNKAFRAHRAGFLSDNEWHDMAKQFHADTSTTGGRAFRESLGVMHADFWEEVDRHVEEGPGIDHELKNYRI